MKKQNGFTAVETLLVVIVLGLVGFVGWYVMNARNKNQSVLETPTTIDAEAKKLSEEVESVKAQDVEPTQEDLEQAKVESTTTTSSTVSKEKEKKEEKPKELTYKSSFEGIQFSYPSDWESNYNAPHDTGKSFTFWNPSRTVIMTFGLPAVLQVHPCGSNTTKFTITYFEELKDLKSARTTYLMKYEMGKYKYWGISDWEGEKPKIGDTDKCSYNPGFQSKKNKEYNIWLRMTDTSEKYLDLDSDTYFNLPDVKTAEKVLRSAKYVD